MNFANTLEEALIERDRVEQLLETIRNTYESSVRNLKVAVLQYEFFRIDQRVALLTAAKEILGAKE